MARYFYDLLLGDDIALDEIGSVCRDDKAALRNGRMTLAKKLSQDTSDQPWQHSELVVRREDGVCVGRVGMTVVTSSEHPVAASDQPFLENRHAG